MCMNVCIETWYKDLQRLRWIDLHLRVLDGWMNGPAAKSTRWMDGWTCIREY